MTSRRFVCVEGSPSDMGEQLGKALSADIGRFIDARIRLLAQEMSVLGYEPVSDAIIAAAGQAMSDSVGRMFPDIWQELDALAYSSGHSLGLISALGAYTDLFDVLTSEAHAPMVAAPEECTAFIRMVTGQVPESAGQTWDMPPGTSDFAIIVERRPVDGNRSSSITLPTGMSYIGVAPEAGLFVGMTNVSTKLIDRRGVIFPAIVQQVIQYTDTAESAAATIQSTPAASGHFYYLVDPVSSVEVEASPLAVRVNRVSENFAHTNHFLSSELQVSASSDSPTWSSAHRMKSMEDNVSAVKSVMDFRLLLLDHENGLCKHGELRENDVLRGASGGAAFYAPDDRAAYFCIGRPCISEWIVVDFDDG